MDFTDSVSAMRASGRSAPTSRPMATRADRLRHGEQDGVGRSDDVGHLRAGIADIAPHEAGDPVGRPGDGAVDDDDVVARFLQLLGEK